MWAGIRGGVGLFEQQAFVGAHNLRQICIGRGDACADGQVPIGRGCDNGGVAADYRDQRFQIHCRFGQAELLQQSNLAFERDKGPVEEQCVLRQPGDLRRAHGGIRNDLLGFDPAQPLDLVEDIIHSNGEAG